MRTPWGDLDVSDAHTHFFSRRFFDALTKQSGRSAWPAEVGWTTPPEDPAELAAIWAAELDRHGVARAVLIASMPGDEASVLSAVKAFPDRFLAYAMIDPTAPNAGVAEGLHGICLFPAMHRYSMHDERVARLLDLAVERQCAVFVHSGVLSVGIRKKLALPCPFDMRFSNPLDLHAVALRYPKLRFIVPHFGAGYFREALMLADLCPNVVLDTSSSNSWMRYEGLDLKTVFRRALDIVGPARLRFGTDSSFFPRGWHADIFEQQSRALYELGLSAPDARLIFAL